MAKTNRKKYLVDRQYQTRLMMQVVVLVVVATSVSAISTYLLTNREISSAFYLAHRKTWDLKELLLPVITGTSLITFLVVSLISSYITLRETHRIVGPLSRLKEALADISEGRITWVGSVRKGDVLKGFDDSINNLADNLSRSMDSIRGAMAEVEAAVLKLEESGEASGQQLEAVRERVRELGESLEFFRRE